MKTAWVGVVLAVVGCGGAPDAEVFGALGSGSPVAGTTSASTASATAGPGGGGSGAGGASGAGGQGGATASTTGSSGSSGPGTTASSGAGGGDGGAGGGEPDPCAGFEAVVCPGVECGPVLSDCDNDGIAEVIECGGCPLPEMCGDNNTPNHCGSYCLSQYAFICQAGNKPNAWGVLTGCEYPYVIQNGVPFVRPSGIDACVFYDTGGQSYTCCP